MVREGSCHLACRIYASAKNDDRVYVDDLTNWKKKHEKKYSLHHLRLSNGNDEAYIIYILASFFDLFGARFALCVARLFFLAW